MSDNPCNIERVNALREEIANVRKVNRMQSAMLKIAMDALQDIKRMRHNGLPCEQALLALEKMSKVPG